MLFKNWIKIKKVIFSFAILIIVSYIVYYALPIFLFMVWYITMDIRGFF